MADVESFVEGLGALFTKWNKGARVFAWKMKLRV
jgi:hypothetical protein